MCETNYILNLRFTLIYKNKMLCVFTLYASQLPKLISNMYFGDLTKKKKKTYFENIFQIKNVFPIEGGL